MEKYNISYDKAVELFKKKELPNKSSTDATVVNYKDDKLMTVCKTLL